MRQPDPNEPKDVFICLECTATARVDGYSNIMLHKNEIYFKNRDPLHFPPWGTQMTLTQQREMFDYEQRIRDDLSEAIAQFIYRLTFERSQGIRNPDVEYLGTMWTKVDINTIAKRSDATDKAMFPEEVMDWRNAHRDLFQFPYHLVTIPHPQWDGDTHETLLTQGEIYSLCIHLNETQVGVGSQLFAGRLADQFNEQELKDHWEK